MSTQKRIDFFLRQSEACTRLGLPPKGCLCPLCGGFFTRDDLNVGLLTIEHVPPRSIGGKAMCLTCAACNNTAGSTVDASVAELARLRKLNTAFFSDVGDFEGRASLAAGGITVNARINKIEGQSPCIEVHEGENHPELFGKMQEHLRATTSAGPGQFGVSAQFRTDPRTVFASLLRCGYLAAFSLFGYRYAGSSRLDVVRQQIREPHVDHIPRIGICFNNVLAFEDGGPLVAVMTAPFPGVAVYFPATSSPVPRSATVFLPSADGPDDFYQAIVSAAQGSVGVRTFNYTLKACAYLTGPQLCNDFAEPCPIEL